MSDIHPILERILTQHIAILGKTGSGKTFTAKVMVEMLLRKRQRVCVIDPTSAWWGLRSDRSGKGPGFSITVFGGLHGDLPIERHHGQSIAEIIATTDTSAIIDTKLMTVGARTQFFTDFAETLLIKNAGTLQLVIDEAHLFAPQGKVADPQSSKMLHAANNLVSLGRSGGLRIIMISQRPSKLHKDSLTQAETLIAMRLIAPQDRNAARDWIVECADPALGAELMKSLPSLPTGEGWIWSPEKGILQRAKFPMIDTYDSSRAPDGSNMKVTLAKIDLPAIEERLKAVAADLTENDPKRLRARLAELEHVLSEKPAASAVDTSEIERQAEERGYQRASQEARKVFAPLIGVVRDFTESALTLIPADDEIEVTPPPRTFFLNEQHESRKPAPVMPARPAARSKGSGVSSLGNSGLRRILIALAQKNGLSARQVGVRAGLSSSSGSFGTYLGKGRTEGWITGNRERLEITSAGLKVLGAYDPLPTGRELLQYWLGELGNSGASRILQTLAERKTSFTAAQVGERTGLSASSGSFGTYLGKLRALELVEGSRDALRASPDLF